MQKVLFVVLALLTNLAFHAQVSISVSENSPNPDAGFDVDFTDKGFLPPRIALQSTSSPAPLAQHVEGMVAYNTTSDGDLLPGLFTNDGTKWVALTPVTYTAGGGIEIIGTVISASGGSVVCPELNTGDSYGGGIIVSTSYPASPCGYLVVPTTDQHAGVVWGCTGTSIPSATFSYHIGAGKDNTKEIVSGCANASFAAKICENHSVTIDNITYSDWFLPSGNELEFIWARRNTIGNFGSTSGEGYWSSSESTANNAFHVNSSWGSNKNNVHRVRCARAF